MTNVIISSFAHEASGEPGTQPLERLSFQFQKLCMRATPLDPEGTPTTACTA
jgi:type VI protein secretion system component Hcp